MTVDWERVLAQLEQLANTRSLPDGRELWRAGQELSLAWIVRQLRSHPGVLVADEVGLGKTRLAVALAVCVAGMGGRVAVLIPPGLAFQWQDEELAGFVQQVRSLQPGWLAEPPRTRFLRTYADLFAHAATYPVSQPGSILFISHGFGLPPVGRVKKDELWALPYLAKRAAGHTAWGAGGLATSEAQQRAAAYIGRNCDADLRRRLESVAGKPSAAAFQDPERARLFENLIGHLIGDVDLLVIDEAHKSRAGADVTLAQKREENRLSSRLTRLVDNILLRPGSTSTAARRLALTATPMELHSAQWRAIFSRLGMDAAEVKRLDGVVTAFTRAVERLRSGSDDELQQLAAAAGAFQDEMQEVVTRRLWRDHPPSAVTPPSAALPKARIRTVPTCRIW